jgi:diguanylate cyclase (GGDEF)-like protein
MVVEDSIAMRDRLLAALSHREDVEVLGAFAGEDEAVTALLAASADLVLLDLCLSPGSGLQVLRRLRASGSKARVLMIGSHADEAVRRVCLAQGASGFLDKSGDLDVLLAEVLGNGTSRVAVAPAPADPPDEALVIDIDPRRQLAQLKAEIAGRRLAEAQLVTARTTDPLTGLAHRSTFLARTADALQRAGGAGGHLALLSIDIDHFRSLNDTLGNAVGDAILVAVAERLRGLFRDSDLFARLAGDQFGVLLTELASAADAARIAARIGAQFGSRLTVEGYDLVLSASVGLCLYPDHGVTADDLLRHAEQAVAHARERGGAQVALYTGALGEAVEVRAAQAIDRRANLRALRQ